MTERERIVELVAQMLDSDRTPEAICVDCPELVEKVRTEADRARQLQRELDELYPALADEPSGPLDVASAADELPVIDGYDVVGVLGRGGMGIVYKANHKKLNRAVALKTLAHGAFAGREERARFQREAETIAALQHPNIVHVHDVGEVQGVPYFTMEFIGGGTLAQKFAGAPWAALPAAALVATLADAVEAAHSSGIVHRDLKPANVLIAAGDVPKITDFGLARRVEGEASLTSSGARIGTPSYMAPEQALGNSRSIGPASDIYSLGAILYEALTGRPPFLGETALETQRQVVSDEVVAPSRLNSGIPRDLETICLKCLEKNPAHRYARAADLAEDLRRFQRSEPVAARRTGVTGRLVRWVKRRPAAAGLIGALTLLLAAAAVGTWSLLEQREAGRVRQLRADQGVRGDIDRVRGALEHGWQEADVASLTEVTTQSNRVLEVARLGGAGPAAAQEAETFHRDAQDRLEHVTRDRALLESILDISTTRDLDSFISASRRPELPRFVPDAETQYAAAFRQWGLDVDGTPVPEIVAQLLLEPAVVVEEIVAGVDDWMVTRRTAGRPESEWRRLSSLADGMDRDEQRRRLRALLIEGKSGTVESETALRRLCQEIDPATKPVLTVLLLQRLCRSRGDAAAAESVLRRAVMARPDQVTLLGALGTFLAQKKPPSYDEALGFFWAARALRPHLGIALSSVFVLTGRAAEGKELLRELIRVRPQDPLPYSQLGGIEYDLQDFDEAIRNFQKVLELRPGDVNTTVNIGNSWYCRGKYGEAEAALRIALERDPDSAPANDSLGCVLHAQGRRDEAEIAWRRALELEPRGAMEFYHIGLALKERRQFDQAEASYRKSIEIDPAWGSVYRNLGELLRLRGRLVEAEATLRKAVEVDPDHANSHAILGSVLRDLARFDDAVVEFRKAIALAPDFAEAHAELGTAFLALGKRQDAEAACRKAIELSPGMAIAYLNLGFALYPQGRFVDAQAAARKSIELNPGDARAHYLLACALRSEQKLPEAEAEFRKALECRPDYVEVCNDLGTLLYARSKFGEAEAMFRKAVEIRPNVAMTHGNLADCLLSEGRDEEAIESARKAVEIDSKYAVGFRTLGMILNAEAKYREAESSFRSALELDPRDFTSYCGLGISFDMQGELPKSEEAFRKSLELAPDFGSAMIRLGRCLTKQARFREAADVFETASSRIPGTNPMRSECLHWLRRCEEALAAEARLPGILAGSERPSNSEEAIQFARLCRCKRLDVAATRCFEDAFDLDPRLADDLEHQHRCDAAACAICAAADESNDLEEAERIRMREEAREWLTADLAARRVSLANHGIAGAEQRRLLKTWFVDSDFASVRDEGAGKDLSDEERLQWNEFWRQVEAAVRPDPEKN